jgi:hypothetical protein
MLSYFGSKHNFLQDVKIIKKSDSKFMRFIGFLFKLFLKNNSFMESVTTIVGKNIYVHNNFYNYSDKLKNEIIIHELVHIYQSKNSLLLFWLLYFWPLSQGLFFLLCSFIFLFFNISIYFKLGLFVFSLIHFLPLKISWFRINYEIEAYNTGFYFLEKNKEYIDSLVDWIAKSLSGALYYYAGSYDKIRKKIIYTYLNSYSDKKLHPILKTFKDYEMRSVNVSQMCIYMYVCTICTRLCENLEICECKLNGYIHVCMHDMYEAMRES